MDEHAYSAWFLTEGKLNEMPLGRVTLREDLKRLRRISAAGVDLDAVTVRDAKAFLVERLRSGQEPGSVNGESKALARWMRYRDGEPVKLPRWPEGEAREKALTPEQVFRALGYVHENPLAQLRARALVSFAVASMCEPAEVSPMDDTDVDFERGGVQVDHPSKGHLRGFVPMSAAALSSPRRPSLATWLKRRPVAPDDPHALWTTLPTRGRGHVKVKPERMTPEALSAELQRVAVQTGVPINWFATRHTGATWLVDAGLSLRYIQKLLRLRSLQYVSRYGEARELKVIEGFRRVGGINPHRKGHR